MMHLPFITIRNGNVQKSEKAEWNSLLCTMFYLYIIMG